MAKRNIAVVTGSRAEYGLLQGLMRAIKADAELELSVVVTGMHLSPEFGLTYKEIEKDGFVIDARIEMLLSSDTTIGVAKSIGLGTIGFADAFAKLAPDAIVVLGDRYEIFAACQSAMVMQIPIAHLAGGDMGAGTYDNVVRHCISKMAALHFVTHAAAAQRVRQLGEPSDRVFEVGATAVDNIVRIKLQSRDELERDLGIELTDPVFLITYHPLTMDESNGEKELGELLVALDRVQRERLATLVFTKPNADNGGRALIQQLEKYVAAQPKRHLFDSLGQRRYLSLTKLAAAVVGNSSSGIYEAPYLRTPTVDIGSRQEGRISPASVLRCGPDSAAIHKCIEEALRIDFDGIEMIYGNGTAVSQILAVLKQYVGLPGLSIKKFIDRSG